LERRILIVTYLVIFVFILLIFRIWDLQVIRGREFKSIAESNRLRVIEIPSPRGLIYDRNNIALVKNIPSFDISAVKEDFPEDPERLAALSKLIGLSPEIIEERLEKTPDNPFVPIKLKLDVTMEEVARVEARKMDFPGLQVDVVISREYLYGELASHVIGYLGRLTFRQARDPDFRDVPRQAFIGQMGAEKTYDRLLRGKAGKKFIEIDAMGRAVRVAGVQQTEKGEDIRLTIDMKLQSEAEDALRGKAGSVIALDVNSGEILALVSMPNFDPNLFARGIAYNDWQKLVNNPLKPFLNRSLQSQYPPGSTFKPITALAALEEAVITDNTKFECRGSIDIGRIFKCWNEKGHGNVDLYRAIVESCDVYFYEIGKRLNIDTLARYASGFGLGRPTGIELEGERAGIVPSEDWKKKTKKEKWYVGESLNTVIGQGYLSTTPLQMARLTAALVNGGKLYKPHLLKGSSSNAGVEETIEISPGHIRMMKKAMLGVVTDKNGTGLKAKSDIVSIGGKTGTTQVVGWSGSQKEIPDRYRDHAWFIAFAPVENPQIALSVFVEHGGHGSTAAAPIAKRVIEKYFKRTQISSEQKAADIHR
jgi:penicillin-binding protein 2